MKMASPGVSKLWSCGTLFEGMEHVLSDSATLDEAALERELKDSECGHYH